MKGADTVILRKLDKFSQNYILNTTKQHIDNFAKEGLRTLCYSIKYLDINEFSSWDEKYKSIKFKAINDKNLIPEKLQLAVHRQRAHRDREQVDRFSTSTSIVTNTTPAITTAAPTGDSGEVRGNCGLLNVRGNCGTNTAAQRRVLCCLKISFKIL